VRGVGPETDRGNWAAVREQGTRRISKQAAKYAPSEYRPIDISRHALDTCEAVLNSVARVRIEPDRSDIPTASYLRWRAARQASGALVCFLGQHDS